MKSVARLTVIAVSVAIVLTCLQGQFTEGDAQVVPHNPNEFARLATGSAEVKVAPSTQTVSVGDTFTVEIFVEGAEDLAAYEFILEFDPALVSVTDVEDGGFLGSTGNDAIELGPEYDPGQVWFETFAFGMYDGPYGTGTLATVTLRAASDGTSALTLSDIQLSTGAYGVEQPVSAVQDGEVVVEAANTVHLPLVMRRYPPIPEVPVLNPIENPNGDEDYTVTWDAAYLANTYLLEEADNARFTGATTQYSGVRTYWDARGKATGTYYYRVKARNAWGDSGWSKTQTTSVTGTPSQCEQHDILVEGTVFVYEDGVSGDAYAEKRMTVKTVEVKSVLGPMDYGGTFYIEARINGDTVASWSQYVGADAPFKAYYHSAGVSFDLEPGDKITYFVYGGTMMEPVGALSGGGYIRLCP